ncbi:MAG: hypothetical protein ACREPR_22005 [Brasilonema sp.]
MEELIEFIQENPDLWELKRVLAVQMARQNYNHSKIKNILGVAVGFVNQVKSKKIKVKRNPHSETGGLKQGNLYLSP